METLVLSLGQKDPSGGGNDNTLQYSCPENPMNRGAWRAMVHRVAKSGTLLNDLKHTHDPRKLHRELQQKKKKKNAERSDSDLKNHSFVSFLM